MLRKLLTGLAVVLCIAIGVRAADNYAATQGLGKNFRCVEIGGSICFPAFIMSDNTGQLLGTVTTPVAVTSTALNTIVNNTTGVAQGVAISGLTTALISGQTTGGLAQIPFIDPCQANVAISTPISMTTATTARIITGTASKKTYICYLYLQTNLANNIAIIEGTTGATCGTATAALVGGITAANGLNNAANSGQAMGNGGFSVMQTQTNQNDVCLITSTAGPLAGTVKYVVQ